MIKKLIQDYCRVYEINLFDCAGVIGKIHNTDYLVFIPIRAQNRLSMKSIEKGNCIVYFIDKRNGIPDQNIVDVLHCTEFFIVGFAMITETPEPIKSISFQRF